MFIFMFVLFPLALAGAFGGITVGLIVVGISFILTFTVIGYALVWFIKNNRIDM
jgi:hypothetical protein